MTDSNGISDASEASWRAGSETPFGSANDETVTPTPAASIKQRHNKTSVESEDDEEHSDWSFAQQLRVGSFNGGHKLTVG